MLEGKWPLVKLDFEPIIIFGHLEGNDDFIESDTSEREEWMILADLKLKGGNESNKRMDCSADSYEQDRLKYTNQEIGDVPRWINMQKNSNALKNDPTPNPVDIKKFKVSISSNFLFSYLILYITQ